MAFLPTQPVEKPLFTDELNSFNLGTNIMKKPVRVLIISAKQFFVQVFAHLLVVILIAEMSIFALPVSAAEGVVVDPNAPGNKPTVDAAPNGVTLINLATTNSRGVSHNKFTDYNVSPKGVILNNSTTAGVSQLGGAIYGNPNYQGGQAASLVINEVTGNKRSNLNGYTEMFGKAADFILANPNGIVCNGAGFINIPRVTLGTGIPVFNSGIFQGLDIRGGDVSIEGSGLDASQADYFTIVTRMASLNGPVWGKDVSIITGTGLYNYNDKVFTQSDTADGKPVFAIDASALGSIYAGRISLICNEKGVGVRSQSDLLADASDIKINADGNIELKNVQAARNIEAASISGEIVQTGAAIAVTDIDYSAVKTTNRGSMTAMNNLSITGGLDNDYGSIASNGNININTSGVLNNRSGQIIQAGNEAGSLNIDGLDGINGSGGIIKSSGALTLGMTGDITLSGREGMLYAERDFTLNAADVVNNIDLNMNGNININASGSVRTNSGSRIVSNNAVNLNSGGDVSNSGEISGAGIAINSASLENNGGITGGKNNTIIDTTGDVNNSGRISSESNLTINAANVINARNAGAPDVFPEMSSGTDLEISANSITNKAGLIYSAGRMALNTASLSNESTGISDANPEGNTAYIYSQGKLDINGTAASGNKVYNYSGYIESDGDMTINLGADGKLENTGADIGNYSSEVIHFGGHGNEYWALMDQTYLYTGTMQTISGYITSQNNMNIITGELKNHGSVISAAENLEINANNVINETYSIAVPLINYQHWGLRHHWTKRIKVGPASWKYKEGNDYYDYWSPGTVTVSSTTQALIQAGSNLEINADHVFNGLSSNYDPNRKDEISNTHNTIGNTGQQGNISSVSADLQNTGAIDISDYITIGPNGDAMFKLNKNPESRYLIETRSQYVDLSSLYGSDYFFSRIDYNPDSQIKLLGDAYYEQKLVMNAIYQTTAEKYLSESIKSDQEEMKYLLDNAATAYRDLKLSVGVALTKEQINTLQEPIIWYVETKVKGITVLAPKIYIPEHIIAGFSKNSVPKIAGGTADMNITGGLINSGIIQSKSSININAGNITNVTRGNTQAQITGNDVSLTSKGDITNTGGAIKGENSLSLNADGDIINEAIVNTSIVCWTETELHKSKFGNKKALKQNEKSEIRSSFSSATIESGGTLTINAGGNFTNKSGKVKADGNTEINISGDIINETLVSSNTYRNGEVKSNLGPTATIESGGKLAINAGGDFTNIGAKVKSGSDAEINVAGNIDFETVKLRNVTRESRHGVNGVSDKTTSAGSSLEVGGNLKMNSESDVYFIGSTADIKGKADVKTAGNFNLINDYDTDSFHGTKTEKKSFGRKKTTTVDTYDSTIVASSFKTGGDLNVESGNDVNVVGSNILSDGNTNINTEGTYNIIAANEEHYFSKSTKKGGFGTGGSVYGSEKKTDTVRDTKANASNLEIKGKYASHSKKDTNIAGSNITASEAEITTDGSLNIVAAYDTHDEQHMTEKSGWGGSGGKNMFSMEMTDKGSGYKEAKGSVINAGKLTLKSASDILVEGSTINADDASIDAAGNFMEMSAQNTSYSYEVSQKASVTSASGFKKIAMSALTAGYTSRNEITFEKDGKFYKPKSETVQFRNGRFFVEMGRADYDKLDTKTDSTTQTSSNINIGNSLSIKAGKYITIAGSNINTCGDAFLDAGGNVNIITAEEISQTRTEHITGSAVVTMGAKNAWVDVAYAGKALLEAKKQLDDAKDAYKNYKRNLAKARDDLAKGLIDREDYESLEGQEKYFKANIALLTENFAAKTANLTMTTVSAVANSSHYGFTGDIQLDVSGSITKSRELSANQIGSNILTGGNLSIKSGETAKIQGSNVASRGDMLIDAQNVEILAAQNTSMSDSDTKSAHINVTINMGGGGGFSADFGMSGNNTENVKNINSHLSGNNIIIKSAKDTIVKGGVVKAEESLELNIGGNLLVESVQDTSTSSSHSFGLSGGYSTDGKKGSGSAGASFSVSESKSKWVNEQASLTGGKVNIYVENKTILKGATIASTANDPANLKLDTGSFEYVNIKDKSTSFSIGANGSVGFNSGGVSSYSAGANYGYSDRRQTNFATVGEGIIIVRNGNGDLSMLHRDVATAQYGTVDVGLKGGVTADKKLMDMIRRPDETMQQFVAAYYAAKKDVNEIIQTGENLYQRTNNLIDGKGFYTDKGVMINECNELWASGEIEGKIIDKYKADIKGNFFKDNEDKTNGKLVKFYLLGLDSEGTILQDVLSMREGLNNSRTKIQTTNGNIIYLDPIAQERGYVLAYKALQSEINNGGFFKFEEELKTDHIIRAQIVDRMHKEFESTMLGLSPLSPLQSILNMYIKKDFITGDPLSKGGYIAASTDILFTVIGSMGKIGKIEKGIDAINDIAKMDRIIDAGKHISKETKLYRYVGEKEADIIRKTGEIPNVNAENKLKDIFITDKDYLTAGRAKIHLQLPDKPVYKVEINPNNVTDMTPIEKIKPTDNPQWGIGRGTQATTKYSIPVDKEKITKLKGAK